MHASTFEGLWRSKTGAEIHLLQSGEAVSGTYTAQATSGAAPSRGRVLIGTADGSLIGFVTSCPAPHTISSWMGRLVQSDRAEAPELHAVCHAVERLSKDLDMARSVGLETVVFTKVPGGPASNSAQAG